MSSVTITYNTVEKRFYLPYTYTNKRKQVRSVNPRPVTFPLSFQRFSRP